MDGRDSRLLCGRVRVKTVWWNVSESHRDNARHGVKMDTNQKHFSFLFFPNTAFVSS